MANNVKFYRLGFGNEGISYDKYREVANVNVNPGAIVFARVKEENGTWDSSLLVPPAYYIYANGIEYKVADANALEFVLNKVNTLAGADWDGKSVLELIDQSIAESVTAELIAAMVDHEASNVKVEVVDSSLVITAATCEAKITVGDVDPEDYVWAAEPNNGDYYVKEVALFDSSVPMRTAYFYNGATNRWVALDGNYSADNIFFPEGVKRNAAWGVATDRQEIAVDEATKGASLTELLEFYLVKELWESKHTTNAAFAHPSFALQVDGDTLPKALYTYVKTGTTTMTAATEVVEVGSAVSINAIGMTEMVTYASTQASKNGTAAKIEFPDYNKYSTDGTTIVAGANYVSATPKATYSYSDTLENATATVTLTKNTGLTGISSSTATVTGLAENNALGLGSFAGVAVEGENKMTLAYSASGASATRSVTSHTDAETISAYGISNKNNVSTALFTANGVAVSTADVNATTSALNYTSTNVVITGVYQIYTDGGKVGNSYTANLNTADCKYADDVKGFGLINYYTTSTITKYIQFGAVTADKTTTKFHEIYFPKDASKKFTITSAIAFNPNKSGAEAYKDAERIASWKLVEGETKTIAGREYEIWRYGENENSGATELKFTIAVANKN